MVASRYSKQNGDNMPGNQHLITVSHNESCKLIAYMSHVRILTVKVPGCTGNHEPSLGLDHLLFEQFLLVKKFLDSGVSCHVLRQLHKHGRETLAAA